jgi:hypothetical protein
MTTAKQSILTAVTTCAMLFAPVPAAVAGVATNSSRRPGLVARLSRAGAGGYHGG